MTDFFAYGAWLELTQPISVQPKRNASATATATATITAVRQSGWRRSAWALVIGLTTLFLCMAPPAMAAEGDDFHDKLMRLGTGPLGGSLEPIGNTLCEAINAKRSVTLVRCLPMNSAGSLFNANAVANGSLQLGLGQEDLVAQTHKSMTVKKGSQLRAVALMHTTPIAVMVRKASGITALEQIRQGRVNVGNKGSGDRLNALAVIKALNLRESDLAGATDLSASESAEAFCKGTVDVVINAFAHPSAFYKRLLDCDGEFLDIPSEVIVKMQSDNIWLRPMTITAGLYRPTQQLVNTVGMRNLLFTHAAVDDEAIFRVATLIRTQFKKLRDDQPALSTMVQMEIGDVPGLGVPLHPGALRALQGDKR